VGLALTFGGLTLCLEGAAARLGGAFPALARSARAMARRLSLGPVAGEGVAAARGAGAAGGVAALRGVFARELEVLPRDWRYSIAMARRLSLGPLLLLPAPGAGGLLACMALTIAFRKALGGRMILSRELYEDRKLSLAAMDICIEGKDTAKFLACIVIPLQTVGELIT